MRIHLIAVGGAAMHNIALDLNAAGHQVTGSDDEIYEPSLTRLKNSGILPEFTGWSEDRITKSIDFVILGMHAKADNPELLKALELKIPVYSYPEFIYRHSINKKRIVIAGSHGKTTTTAMILHVLKKKGVDFDYLVGAQLEGFDRMVKLSDAPLIIIEGDEYLSSPIDRVPKIHHYKPHIAVITGIAWDHMNVFPTFDIYKDQFRIFIKTMDEECILIYYNQDNVLKGIIQNSNHKNSIPYSNLEVNGDKMVILNGNEFPVSIIGIHNLRNMNAAMLVCKSLGMTENEFLVEIKDFAGANKRLQKLAGDKNRAVYLDFAHAPSKVLATTNAFKEWFGNRKLLAVVELHTFSSLNKDFIPNYKSTLSAADSAVVFYNEHTLQMKKMPELEDKFIQDSFDHPNLVVFKDEKMLYEYINGKQFSDYNILLMTSGNFNKMEMNFNHNPEL
ncbi:MAG: Mur ligase family protein [Saprospiraceae bacterium]